MKERYRRLGLIDAALGADLPVFLGAGMPAFNVQGRVVVKYNFPLIPSTYTTRLL